MLFNKKKWIGLVILLIIWQVISLLGIFNPIYFSSPLEVLSEFFNIFSEKYIYLDILYTSYRILSAIAISIIIGVPLGMLLGYSKKYYFYFSGLVDFFRSIPPIVLYPLLLISLGSGDVSRIGVAVFGSVVVLILIISNGLSEKSSLRRDVFKKLGFDKKDVVVKVIWYEALPFIMLGFKAILSLSIIIIIVTEMIVGSKYGLGVRVQNVQITSDIPDLFVTIIVIGVIGVVLNKLADILDRKLIFWNKKK